MAWILLLFIALLFGSSHCEYSIKHTGELVLTNQLNSIVNAKVLTRGKSFNLELNNFIKFPVQCIPHSAVDYNTKKKKKPIYFIKHEFTNSIFLYKNNVNIMPLIFPDRYYIVGIAVNNEFVLMITDVDIYRIDVKKKKLSILHVLSQKHANILNNKEMFFTGVIADSIENQFFIICAIKQNYYIVHVKHNTTDDYIEVLNVIENINGKPMSVVNTVTIVGDRLYIAENSEKIYRLIMDRKNNTVKTKEMYTFRNGDKIVGISGKSGPSVSNRNGSSDAKSANTNNGTSTTSDYLIVNTKKVVNDKPSSEGCLYMMVIRGEDDTVDIFTVLDLYSKDINPLYFTIYDAHMSIDEDEYKTGELLKGVNSDRAKFLKMSKDKEEEEEEKKKKKKEDNKYKLNIIWTNMYNCTINNGTIDFRNIKIEKNGEKKLPFVYVNNHYALAPHVTSVSNCSGKDKLFKDMCYYDCKSNFVSRLNKSEEYNENYSGNFIFDGLKDFIAFDYKSYMDVHILSYPMNNVVYVYVNNTPLIINLPKPFGLSIDMYNSTDNNVSIYITGNDDTQNYVSRCLIKKSEKAYECYNIYRKKNDTNELFQHLSYISYDESDGTHNSFIYLTNNKTNIYKLTKQNDKWVFEEWLNLDNDNQRVGPITTSLNYFFAKKNVLTNLIKKYPQAKLLTKFNNPKEEDLHITDDGYIFLTGSHTIIFCSNNDSYGQDSGSTIHFYTSVLKEKYYQSFAVDSIVINVENDSKFNYYLDQ
ncbi:translocon component PTEX88, putative [Plasmodium ovale]|uniref:Translocon component PTEX88, putative n=2 Tax=Plasmodium ovale TaxID=36330 RepID=A0A1A8VWU3_PLAOA|nr:translocon component PTEX88, putative [Plasmodium ovale curtisi]SBS90255.1 translocon component PTEX88, putative [Plasmodium ovale curtisi]SCP04390.1 translocon component PTEX88, putative [Plasmodium ovale]